MSNNSKNGHSPPQILNQVGVLTALGVVAISGAFAAALSPQEAVAQIIGFCSLISVSLLALLQQMRTTAAAEKVAEKADIKRNEVAHKVEMVKDDLTISRNITNTKLDDLARVTDETRILVNSKTEVLMQLYAVAMRRLAERTQDVGDLAAADRAERAYKEHQTSQSLLDDKFKKIP